MAIMLISRVITPLTLLLITACTLIQTGQMKSEFTPSAVPTVQTTLVPTLQRDLHTIESQVETAAPTSAAVLCTSDISQSIIRYVVIADMNYADHTVSVQQLIEYTNRSNDDLTEVVINVKPNIWPGVFTLKTVHMGSNEQEAIHELVQQRLTLQLPETLKSGCTISIKLSYQLNLPPIDVSGTNAYQGYLGYSSRQTNLGQWLPVVAVHTQQEWISHPEIPIGEQDVLDTGDWDVTLKINDAPSTVSVAAPGMVELKSANEWHFSLSQARDFSLSVGENYRVIKNTSTSRVEIEVYNFEDALLNTDNGVIDSAAFALDTATKSLEMYEDLYGNYPLKRLAIVQGDFPDGMEFSGIVFVGGEYFRGFTGPNSYLMMITAHEVAHQWWYARIGNDQAINPWLDEALATYNEYVFIEEYYPALKDWWWQFRVDRLSPEGFVNSTVYEFSSRRAYINAVYLRGVRMLDDLRNDLGTEAFFDWLRRYAAAGTGQIMTPEQFWSFLSPEQLTMTAATRQRYLRQPQIVVIATDAPGQTPSSSPSQ
jgi:Peptidase family M1 domain